MIPDPDPVTTDRLTRDWTISQRRRGHRHSTDDLLTGHYATLCAPSPRRVLDLGSGVGSVAMLVLWRSPEARVTAIEAQEVSFRLLEENVARNELGGRVLPVLGDLRGVRFDGESFDLVTGSPPYFGVSEGIVPADSQKAHARFELRGDVRDYCKAARAALGEGGRFVFCFPTPRRERAERAWAAEGLSLVRSRDVVPRRGARPLFSLFCCRREEDPGEPALAEPPYFVRDETGAETSDHRATRAAFGM